jgi:hypothetical protein
VKKRVLLGGLLGLAGAMFWQYQNQKAAWEGRPVPIGNLLRPTDPSTYIAIALGALGAYATH